MALKLRDIRAIFEEISEEFDIDLNKIYAIAGDRVKRASPFTPKAKKIAEENGLKADDIPHTGDKITIDDVRNALGTPKKKAEKAIATPQAKKLAEDFGVDITKITPSGKKGKILKGDILEFLKTMNKNDSSDSESEDEKPKKKKVTKKKIVKKEESSDSDSE